MATSNSLHDVTRRRLFQFRGRRLQLMTLQGAGWAATAAACGLLLAVVIDATVDQNWGRWVASCITYSVACCATYWLVLLPWLSRPSIPLEARLMEKHEPQLRDRLLSAVELSSDEIHGPSESDSPRDSLAFRNRLQQQVAQTIGPIDVRQILPWQSIRTAVGIGTLACLTVLMLCAVPRLHLPQRIARAMFPFANLGRVSSIQIELESPTPRNKIVPLEDVVAVLARVEGPQPEEIWLETRRAGQLNRFPMATRLSDDSPDHRATSKFECTLVADAAVTDYRVVAKGASTPWYRLEAFARPRVARFEKSIQPPEYTNLTTSTFTEDNGNITALVGSEVELALSLEDPSEAMSEVLLRWEDVASAETTETPVSSSSESIRLHLNDAQDRWTTTLEVRESRRFRVDLQSQASGFRNDFSPTYEIVAIDDEAPKLRWMEPKSTLTTASLSELLSLSVSVTDEMEPQSLLPQMRVNQGGWTALDAARTVRNQKVLASDTFTAQRDQYDFQWQLDLLPLELSAGDIVEVKAIATDRKGQVTESESRRIMISTVSIQTDPDSAELARRNIAERLEALASVAEEKIAPKLKEVRSEELSDLVAELQERIPAEIELITNTSRSLDNLSDTSELRDLGSHLTRVLTHAIPELTTPAEKDPKRLATEARRLRQEFLDLASHARSYVSYDIASRLSTQLVELSQAQQELTADESLTDEQYRRRQAVLLQELHTLEKIIATQSRHVHPRSKSRFASFAEQFGNSLIPLDDHVRNGTENDRLRALGRNVSKSLRDWALLSRIDGNIYELSNQGHRWANHKSLPLGDRIEQALRDSAEPSSLPQTQAALAKERELAKASKFGDRQLASDLGRLSRAVGTVYSEDGTAEQRQQVIKAARVLTAAGELRIALSQLQDLTRAEKWNLDVPQSSTENPRLYDLFVNQQEKAINLVRRLNVSPDVNRQLNLMQWNDDLQRAGDSVRKRLWEAKPAVSASADLNRQAERLQKVLQTLDSEIQEARHNLQALSPSLQELAQRAAEATQQVSQQTEDLGNRLEKDEVPDPDVSVTQLEQSVDELADPIADLREALVDEADSKQLLDQKELPALRRADAAIDIVDQVQEQTQESLADLPSDASQIKPENLAMAAEQQKDASEALQQLAELLNPQNASNADMQELRSQQAPELADSSQQQEQELYESAEQLARLAQASPEDVLEALEAQLPKNREMREELSEIAEAAAKQALETLEQAADRQQQIRPRLENSDPTVLAEKNLLLHDLQTVRNEANQMTGVHLAEASRAAQVGKQTEQSEILQQTLEELRQAVDDANGANNSLPMQELRTTASKFKRALETASEQLAQTQTALDEAQNEQVFNSGAELNNRRREMKDRARRVQQNNSRNMQQALRTQQQQERRSQSELRNADKNLENANKELQQRQKELEQARDGSEVLQEQRQERLAQAEQKKQVAEEARAAAEDFLEAVQARKKESELRLAAANKSRTPSLDSPNPAAELASSIAEQAAQHADHFAQRLEPWSGPYDLAAEATRSQVMQEQNRQQDIQENVEESAETVARAARHEERLGNTTNGQRLDQAASQILATSNEEIERSKERLQEASQNNTDSPPGKASASTTQNAAEASTNAEQAIREAATSLGQAISTSESKPQTNASSSPPSNSVLPAQQMAQLLDEIDQQLNGSQPNSPPQNSSSSAQANQPSQGDSSAQPQSPSSGQQSLGQQDNNSQNPMLNQGVPTTLAQAAQQLAAQLSQNRQSQSKPQANQDLGMATEADMANVDPQPPVPVQVVNVERLSDDWGTLRDQRADGSNETQKHTVAPQFREQVDAYYRSLSKQRR